MRIKVLLLIVIGALYFWSAPSQAEAWYCASHGMVTGWCDDVNAQGAPFGTWQAAVDALEPACIARLGPTPSNNTHGAVSHFGPSLGIYTTSVAGVHCAHVFGSTNFSFDTGNPCMEGELTFDSEGMPLCQLPPECDPGNDTGKIFAESVDPQATGNRCMTDYGDGCVAVNTGGMCLGAYCKTYFKLTATECAGGESNSSGALVPAQTECVTQSGQQVCAQPTEPPKTSVDGNPAVDLDAVVPDGCFQFASGGVICGDAADSPPAPDNGVTPGTTADPDLELTNSSGDTINYYNSTTVNNSEGPVEGTDPQGPTGDGSGGDGDGDGDCSGGDCDGELPGDNEEVDSFGDLTAAFLARVEASPLISAVGDVQGAAPPGSCEGQETAALAVFGGETLAIDAHCSIWAEIAPLLYNVMLAAWVILGVVIILRA